MTPVKPDRALDRDHLSWKFLESEFCREPYGEFSIERRLDAYLRHHQLNDLLNDGNAYDQLLGCVMANIGPARRSGMLDAINPPWARRTPRLSPRNTPRREFEGGRESSEHRLDGVDAR